MARKKKTQLAAEHSVILSTHIVQDVSDLCPQLAIMNKGRVLITGTPQALVAALRGKVWTASVARQEVAAAREKYAVISTRLYTGKTQIHVWSDERPGPGFEPVEATLEDAYFATINGHIGDALSADARKAA